MCGHLGIALIEMMGITRITGLRNDGLPTDGFMCYTI